METHPAKQTEAMVTKAGPVITRRVYKPSESRLE